MPSLLLVKTSSLGDVIHNLPVLADIHRARPDVCIDWCVEEPFVDLLKLHPLLRQVLPVAVRRWRKSLWRPSIWREIAAARRHLAAEHYDWVVDTQGLLKSAVIAAQCCGLRSGFARGAVREPLATWFYQQTFLIERGQHAVTRNRLLVAAALGYSVDDEPDYGLSVPESDWSFLPTNLHQADDLPWVVALTATSRNDKLWAEVNWVRLGTKLRAEGFRLLLPAGSSTERARAARLAANIPDAVALPPMNLPQLTAVMARAAAVVGVDTGLTHLAVALEKPTVAIFTATDPNLTGVYGRGFYRNLGGKNVSPAVSQVLQALRQGLQLTGETDA